MPTEELALWCYGVEVRVVDAAGLGLCQRLRETLPPEFVAPSGLAGAAVAYVVTAGALAGTANDTEYVISCDGVEVFAATTEEDVFVWLRHDIDQAVARRSPQMLFVHAGVVGWRGVAIVIPGRRATGKSTLAAELVRRGAVYYSDAFAVLDQTGRVHPYRGTIGSADERQPPDLRLVREEMPTEPLPIGLVVAGDYRPGGSWRPTIVRGGHTALPLIDSTVLGREEAATNLEPIAAHLTPNLVTLRGPRPEATEVATQLLDLMDDAFVSHALEAASNGAGHLTDDLAPAAEIRVQSLSPDNVRTFARSAHAKRLIAVVTPLYRFPLSADEQISLRHLREYLGDFDRYAIGSQSPLPREYSDFALPPFSARYFGDRVGYNRLLVSEQFYRAFADYKYILIYQLDCLVFSSNIEEWCRRGWDYIGAPWFKSWHPCQFPSLQNSEDPIERLGTVGNGGFSLRRVDSALAVLTSPKRVLRDRLMRDFLEHPNSNEDIFWAFSAPKLVECFRIPRPRQALEFAFETTPLYCYQMNSGRLPFGCHAWPSNDPEFWEPFLLR
jgi:Protein of unknown function (DUF5672)